MAVSVNWFEIPAQDMERAVAFYGAALGEPLATMDGPDGLMNVFPADDGPAGALIGADVTPVAEGGVRVYLHSDDIDSAMERIAAAGGEVLMGKTPIGPHGFIGTFKDTEGNTVALHTPT